jgi:hypothetical protein
MAKSRKRKNHNEKVEKRNMKGAREIMHESKRKQNMKENIKNFMEILKEFGDEMEGN